MSRAAYLLTVLLIYAASGACEAVLFVDAACPGPVHNGSSWSTAFKTIQQAVNSSVGGDIWIRAGTYREPVTLKHCVNLYGGFMGYETSLSQRLLGALPTIIDGGMARRGIDVPEGAWVTIDGLTVRRGRADVGAGIRCNANSRVNVRNCRIENCSALQQAGGIYYGVYTQGEMTDCVIACCSGPNGAGGVIEYHSYPTWRRSLLIHNHATQSGGGIYCPFHSGAVLENCTLAFNSAGANGGAAYAHYGGAVTLSRCILAFNSAPEGGGIYGGGSSSQVTLSQNDFYANSGGDFGGAITTPSPSLGNIYVDPMFVKADYNDFHLSLGSPCAGIGAYPLGAACVVDRIGVAKMLPDGTPVQLSAKMVGLTDGETTYIQETDRAAAIAVKGLSGCRVGDVLTSLVGTMATHPGGTRYLAGASAAVHPSAVCMPRPLAVRMDWLGDVAGLVTRTWGTVGAVSPTGFTLVHDGFSLFVRGESAGVSVGDMVSVTGTYTIENDFVLGPF